MLATSSWVLCVSLAPHTSLITNDFFKILVPLVEKVAEHLTAVDEAHDNQVSVQMIHIRRQR